jgi:hypothetical protein
MYSTFTSSITAAGVTKKPEAEFPADSESGGHGGGSLCVVAAKDTELPVNWESSGSARGSMCVVA